MHIDPDVAEHAAYLRDKQLPNLGQLVGMEFIHFAKDCVKASMPVDARTHQPFGLLHGGASVVLAESVASIGAWLNCDFSYTICCWSRNQCQSYQSRSQRNSYSNSQTFTQRFSDSRLVYRNTHGIRSVSLLITLYLSYSKSTLILVSFPLFSCLSRPNLFYYLLIFSTNCIPFPICSTN
jgi:uncharacterized domain 1